MDHPSGGVPAERLSLKRGLEDIHPAVGHDPEFKAAGGTDAQGGNSLGLAVCMCEMADATHLGEPAGMFQQKFT
jgi:hypothetical protein